MPRWRFSRTAPTQQDERRQIAQDDRDCWLRQWSSNSHAHQEDTTKMIPARILFHYGHYGAIYGVKACTRCTITPRIFVPHLDAAKIVCAAVATTSQEHSQLARNSLLPLVCAVSTRKLFRQLRSWTPTRYKNVSRRARIMLLVLRYAILCYVMFTMPYEENVQKKDKTGKKQKH